MAAGTHWYSGLNTAWGCSMVNEGEEEGGIMTVTEFRGNSTCMGQTGLKFDNLNSTSLIQLGWEYFDRIPSLIYNFCRWHNLITWTFC